jgi:hypothetical protein
MSSEEAATVDDICANCGISAIDDVKLKKCDGGCDLVKYCSNECQDNHRPQHNKECKRRFAELRKKDLFEQPDESHWGECPICCLPLSIDPSKSRLMSCCCQTICNGCHHANQKREYEAGLMRRCAFCREPLAKSGEEIHQKRLMKRVKKNCPVAMREMGKQLNREEKYEISLEYLTKAAELGDTGAHFELSCLYFHGEGVEKDEKKHIYHLEEAAIGGHPAARYNLGVEEWNKTRFDIASKHFIIAANLGDHNSLKELRRLYVDGHASKADYSGALRAYQAAVEATKSAERKKAEEYYEAKDAAQQR